MCGLIREILYLCTTKARKPDNEQHSRHRAPSLEAISSRDKPSDVSWKLSSSEKTMVNGFFLPKLDKRPLEN